MNKLLSQFPDGTVRKKDKVMWVDTSRNQAFHKRFFREVGAIIFICGAAVIGGIVLLILMGALKALGVKEL